MGWAWKLRYLLQAFTQFSAILSIWDLSIPGLFYAISLVLQFSYLLTKSHCDNKLSFKQFIGISFFFSYISLSYMPFLTLLILSSFSALLSLRETAVGLEYSMI